MDSFAVELKLVDSISSNANRAATAVVKVKETAKQSNSELSALGKQFEKIGFAGARAAYKQQQAFAASWVKIGNAAERANQQSAKASEHAASKHRLAFANSWEKIGNAADKSKKQDDKHQRSFAASWSRIGYAAEKARIQKNKEFAGSVRSHMSAVDRMEEKLRSKSFGGGFSEGIGFSKLTSAAFLGSFLAEGVFHVVDAFVEGAKKAVEIVVDGVKEAFKSASEEETLRIGETNTLGDAGGKAFRDDIGGFDKLAPFDDSAIRKMMLQMRRAGMSQASSKQAFATAVDIGGGDEGAVGGVLEQFKRIYTKQGIGKKQLVELLGNVGTTIPDFYKALGKKMHLSAKEAEKKAEKGGADPQLIMNMITEAQNKRQGGIAGAGGLKYAKSLAGEWKKINDLPGEYYKKLVDSPGYARATEALGGLLEKLNPESEQGQRIMASVEAMFDKFTSWIGDPDDTAASLADHIGNAVDTARELIDVFGSMAESLVPTLETLEDMVMAARKMKVFLGDKDAALALAQDEGRIDARRTARSLEKNIKTNHASVYGQNLKTASTQAELDQAISGQFGPVDITSVRRAAAKKTEDDENKVRKAAGSSVVMNVVNHVNVHAAPGEESNETHERAGHEVRKHMTTAAERAKAEVGG